MTSTGFGWIKYNGKIHECDVLVLADGTVMLRNSDELMRKFGTHHALDVDEMRLLLKDSPEVIVIGTGQSDTLRLTPAAIDLVKKSDSRLVEGATPKACKAFDSLACRKSALFHVTC